MQKHQEDTAQQAEGQPAPAQYHVLRASHRAGQSVSQEAHTSSRAAAFALGYEKLFTLPQKHRR